MQTVVWKIRLWDELDVPGEWAEAYFETGLSPSGWKARWITTGAKAGKDRLPAEYFRKEFIAGPNIRRARLYATACGTYTAFVNDSRVPGVLAPGTTEYTKRLYP